MPEHESAVARFRRSMAIDYEKWHDGIGYDLDAIASASPEERTAIETLLLSRPVADWRDVEALAAIGTPRAQAALKQALARGDHAVRAAVLSHAPHLVADGERVASLVRALEGAETYGGLTQTLAKVEEFHPQEIVDALFRGVLARDGATAVHFAAMLMFIHGKAKSAFDWDKRPFFLRFNTAIAAEREVAFRELCAKVGAAPARYLGSAE